MRESHCRTEFSVQLLCICLIHVTTVLIELSIELRISVATVPKYLSSWQPCWSTLKVYNVNGLRPQQAHYA